MIKKIIKFFRAILLVFKYGEEALLKDPLTRLYNRLVSNELMRREIWKSERNDNSFCIILLDVDGLKKINDTKGHLEGDKALSQIASIIKKNLRKVDIASRWGGDEFLLMLINTQKQGAKQFLERIKEQVSFGVSVGISEWKKGISIEEMIEIADKEMYKEKNKK